MRIFQVKEAQQLACLNAILQIILIFAPYLKQYPISLKIKLSRTMPSFSRYCFSSFLIRNNLSMSFTLFSLIPPCLAISLTGIRYQCRFTKIMRFALDNCPRNWFSTSRTKSSSVDYIRSSGDTILQLEYRNLGISGAALKRPFTLIGHKNHARFHKK